MARRSPTIDLKTNPQRRYPVGVEVLTGADGAVRAHARVWAPDCRTVELATADDGTAGLTTALSPEGNGYHSGFVDGVTAGTKYRFLLDGADAFPDPASRFQPEGPHGPSMVIDASTYEWGDQGWSGVSIHGQVIYELHIGTFTRSGTFRSAMEKLPDLVDLGVTVIEVMPVADFAGQFGWGYDGVNLFAPSRLYGTPDDFRAFVDAAHRLEMGVILDVVYNHLGPDGNYLPRFSKRYFAGKHTEWGDALNFDGEDSAPVREFFVTNAAYWIGEFHLDGLRLDATQQIFDSSPTHIISDICAAAHEAAGERNVIVVGENEPQDTNLVRPGTPTGGLDALWNDDFHHSAHVAGTGRSEAYFSGYHGSPQELISAAKYGYLYQGQWYAWQNNRRGTPALDLPAIRFVNFLQNHDQVANSAFGRRGHQDTSTSRWRALTALLLLMPQTPMLFQGQEFASSRPWVYFADHQPDIAKLVHEGRAKFVEQFPSLKSRDPSERIADPADPFTFVACKLDWSERSRNVQALHLHKDLLRLRRDDPVLRGATPRIDGAVISDHAFLLRYFGGENGDRLIVVNLGARLHADPLAEPLAAPPTRAGWITQFSTESSRYGGWGTPLIETHDDGWWIPAESAAFLVPADGQTSSR